MKVTILESTPQPIDVISRAAGCCYGKRDASYKRAASCYKSGHLGVFEHACVTFLVEGISRSCSHQLVRHRMASYCQLSQRYKRVDTSKDDWFVIPDAFSGDFRAAFVDSVTAAGEEYNAALKAGVRPEDARYLLPECCKTDVVVTMNWRELFHFWDLRTDERAQWEVRDLAWSMYEECMRQEDFAVVAGFWDGCFEWTEVEEG